MYGLKNKLLKKFVIFDILLEVTCERRSCGGISLKIYRTLNTAYISLCFKLVPVQCRELPLRECRHCVLVLNYFLSCQTENGSRYQLRRCIFTVSLDGFNLSLIQSLCRTLFPLFQKHPNCKIFFFFFLKVQEFKSTSIIETRAMRVLFVSHFNVECSRDEHYFILRGF